MTLILDLPAGMEAAIQQEAERQGTTPERLALDGLRRLFPETDLDTTLAAPRSRPAAMTVVDLKPLLSSPPGTNGMEYVIGHWPGEETEEALQAALKTIE